MDSESVPDWLGIIAIILGLIALFWFMTLCIKALEKLQRSVPKKARTLVTIVFWGFMTLLIAFFFRWMNG